MDAFDKAARLKVLGPYPEAVTPEVAEETYKKFSTAFGSEFPIRTFAEYFAKYFKSGQCIDTWHVLHWYLRAMYHNPLELYKVGAGGAYG